MFRKFFCPTWKTYSIKWWFNDIIDDIIDVFQERVVTRFKTFENRQSKIFWQIDNNIQIRHYLATLYLVSFFAFPIATALSHTPVLLILFGSISVLLILTLFVYNPIEELTLI